MFAIYKFFAGDEVSGLIAKQKCLAVALLCE